MIVKHRIDIAGVGIIFYSDYAAKKIKDGEDYFTQNYNSPVDVVRHVYEGSIVGFCTGSPGTYDLEFKFGVPNAELFDKGPAIRLGILVKDNIYIDDLFTLMDWNTSNRKTVELPDGYYIVTVITEIPESGILGDNQLIHLYFESVDKMPELRYLGVPSLC